MLSKLSRRRGLQLEALGSVLICTVMLADRFLFTLQDDFVLTTAIISAVLLSFALEPSAEHLMISLLKMQDMMMYGSI